MKPTYEQLEQQVLDMAVQLANAESKCRELDEVRAQARNEGINYAASRLAAAFNHGFVDKPLTEVCDVVRMILDTKEELANSTLPAADGISGEYAEKFLAEFAAQLRKGAVL
ncbi:Eae protein [Escherichia coli]